ncbi:hypothetical protein CN140_01810 [Sinorhizobium meliloti]|uniref:hypothetical protein n=1 Tax=Rhizobium meliloti TaxID=382 RepID=UPI000FDA662B|nr:hypothetical protein [Sinorhizobium meliloti]RVL87693.1 hypothetical protein CN140_01810 [Sinorhizobium meliloti]
MIQQQMMSPSWALYYWREHGMTIKNVLRHTGFRSINELHVEHEYDLGADEMAKEDLMMSPEERQREEDVEAVWQEFGDYMREMVPPSEYDLEIERLLPLIQMRQQAQRTAAGRSFNRRQ